jgi:hypothetical protein
MRKYEFMWIEVKLMAISHFKTEISSDLKRNPVAAMKIHAKSFEK